MVGGPWETETLAVAAGGGPHISGKESLLSLSSSLDPWSMVARMCFTGGVSWCGPASCLDDFLIGSLCLSSWDISDREFQKNEIT